MQYAHAGNTCIEIPRNGANRVPVHLLERRYLFRRYIAAFEDFICTCLQQVAKRGVSDRAPNDALNRF